MSQKSSVPQAISFVSQVLKRDKDHPHVFCDMGNDLEYVCPYCSTLYRHNPALAPNQAYPSECELHDVII
jgi:uncharacterized Zn-finger protein